MSTQPPVSMQTAVRRAPAGTVLSWTDGNGRRQVGLCRDLPVDPMTPSTAVGAKRERHLGVVRRHRISEAMVLADLLQSEHRRGFLYGPLVPHIRPAMSARQMCETAAVGDLIFMGRLAGAWSEVDVISVTHGRYHGLGSNYVRAGSEQFDEMASGATGVETISRIIAQGLRSAARVAGVG